MTLLPYLVGERVPNLPLASGALLGLRMGTFNAGHLFRAALEGTTLGLASGVERMKRLGLEVHGLRLVGGGSKNPLWRQIIADCMNAPVEVLLEPESAALGAAIQAAWVDRRERGEAVSVDDVACNFVQLSPERTLPRADNVAVYREQLAAFDASTKQLFG